MRGRVEHTIPGLQIELAQLMEDLIGDLAGTPEPIEVKLYSDDQGPLCASALPWPGPFRASRRRRRQERHRHRRRRPRHQGGQGESGPRGRRPDIVARMTLDYLTGTVTTHIQRDPKMVGVRVWVPRR